MLFGQATILKHPGKMALALAGPECRQAVYATWLWVPLIDVRELCDRILGAPRDSYSISEVAWARSMEAQLKVKVRLL